ncbi:MAG: hypothetical protein IJC09_01570 [Clostridia bacterium]|nr:hypothetical protein [Clostridia bacterium]
MKKFLVVIIIMITISLSGCGKIKEKASDTVADFLIEAYERELDEKIKNHEVIEGRDTVFVWHDHYEICKNDTLDGVREEDLWITVEDADGMILDDLIEYDSKSKYFYVISEEGYAVIDKNDYCRVYLTVPEEEQDKIESKYIEYLDSYEEFSEKERKYFEKMQKK